MLYNHRYQSIALLMLFSAYQATVTSKNILVLQNKLDAEEVTVVIVAKTKNTELNRSNLKPDESLETPIAPDEALVKLEVYYPAAPVERGAINLKDKQPVFTTTKQFKKDQDNQRLVIDIDSKNLHIPHERSSVESGTKQTAESALIETKAIRDIEPRFTAGAGASMSRKTALPIVKSAPRTTGKLERAARVKMLEAKIAQQRAEAEAAKACKKS